MRVHINHLTALQSVLTRLSNSEYLRTHFVVRASSVGNHVRHVLDHYHNLLEGVALGMVDYQVRRRGSLLETNVVAAAVELESVIERLPGLSDPTHPLKVRVEADEADTWVGSTLGRELDYLLAHSVHHMATISSMCRAMHVETHRDFGVAPATLRAERAP